jgi:hypothetical protein
MRKSLIKNAGTGRQYLIATRTHFKHNHKRHPLLESYGKILAIGKKTRSDSKGSRNVLIGKCTKRFKKDCFYLGATRFNSSG